MTLNFVTILVFNTQFTKKKGDKYYSSPFNINFILRYLSCQRIASQILKVEGFLSLYHQ